MFLLGKPTKTTTIFGFNINNGRRDFGVEKRWGRMGGGIFVGCQDPYYAIRNERPLTVRWWQLKCVSCSPRSLGK